MNRVDNEMAYVDPNLILQQEYAFVVACDCFSTQPIVRPTDFPKRSRNFKIGSASMFICDGSSSHQGLDGALIAMLKFSQPPLDVPSMC